jgi:hypothetical protein
MKKNTSEIINRIIGVLFFTIFVCSPWYVPSRVMSRHHWIIVSSMINIPMVNRDWLYRWNHLIIPTMMFRAVFWVVLPCKIIIYRRVRGAYCLHHQGWWSYSPPWELEISHIPTIIPDDGGSTHLWNVGRQSFYTAIHPRDNSEHQTVIVEVRSETSVDNQFTRQYIPEDNSEHHTRRRENLKSHTIAFIVDTK